MIISYYEYFPTTRYWGEVREGKVGDVQEFPLIYNVSLNYTSLFLLILYIFILSQWVIVIPILQMEK